MNTAIKFPGPPITSVLQLVFKSETVPDLGFDPGKLMFKSYDEALAWRLALTPEQEPYLSKIDKFLIQLIPGETVDLSKLVKPENTVLFYRCLFYVMLACDLFGDISFSDDFKLLRLNERWNEKTNSAHT